ncbi:MAG: HAMP domain-containing histidine kinase [Proteobacteria bacterium]|nr:HAMP domain-containing histidine kinase [Pseudomonadota bacterium]
MYRISKTVRSLFIAALQHPLRGLLMIADRAAIRFSPRYHIFWILGMIFCIYPFVIDNLPAVPIDFTDTTHSSMSDAISLASALRAIGIALCILLATQAVWPLKWRQKYLYVTWFVTLMWCLPMLGLYGIFTGENKIFWLIHTLTALFTLAAFVDLYAFLSLSLIGVVIATIAALIQHYFGYTELHLVIPHKLSTTLATLSYIPLYIASIITAYKNREQEHRMRCAFGSALSHELRSPIAQVYSGVEVLADILERGYAISGTIPSKADLSMLPVSDDDYEMLLYLQESIPGIISRGQKYATSVILSTNGVGVQSDNAMHKIADAITIALEEYNLTDSEAHRVHFTPDHDEKSCFYGSLSMLALVVHCLLRNSFKYAGRRASIYIEVAHNQIYLHDDGAGIAPQALPHIFDMHYNTGGTGLGLTLCKSLLISMGAEIECHSELGKKTEFIITFPKL